MFHIKRETQIFRYGSTTFFWSSLLFPKKVRRDIFDLYSFVRVADDYIDGLPQNLEGFYEQRNLWSHAIKSTHFETAKKPADSLNERVVKNMVHLAHAYDFDHKWIDDFLNAMESDLTWPVTPAGGVLPSQTTKPTSQQSCKFKNSETLLFYIHGSAEVVGLMLARIMGLPKTTDRYAKRLGRSLQTINFIRDVCEDNHLGRCYFINSDFQKFGLQDLSETTAKSHPEAFKKFIWEQLAAYHVDRTQAEKGFIYIPPRCLIAIKTAADLYGWTAQQIANDPLIVFQKKVKPGKARILKTAVSNIFIVYLRHKKGTVQKN